MSLRADRVLLTWGANLLVAEANRLGFEAAFDFVKRCQDCPVGKKTSEHKLGRALDLHLYDDLDGDGEDDDYVENTEAHRPLGTYWESLHPSFRWGGRYNDGNHYEVVPGWRTA